jgi:integrase
MPKTKLTEMFVSRMKAPAQGRLDLWDVTLPGFGLRVSQRGVRSWVLMVRVAGKQQRVTLGRYPAMNLAEARAAARQAIHDAARGEGRFSRKGAPVTVAEAVEEFVKRYIKPNRRERSGREAAAQLRRELAVHCGDRLIADIGRRDVLQAIDRVTDRGATIAANRLLANLGRFFGWALERGLIDATPVTSIKAPARERSRDRVLEAEEIEAIWCASGQLGWPFGPIVRLLMVTLQRRDEVARMAWPDIDFEKRLWTLPRELTKADRVHEVPLSPLAMEVIEVVPRTGDVLTFPSTRMRSQNPVSGFSRAKARLDKLSRVTGWRVHDLRRTGASGIARLATRRTSSRRS